MEINPKEIKTSKDVKATNYISDETNPETIRSRIFPYITFNLDHDSNNNMGAKWSQPDIYLLILKL